MKTIMEERRELYFSLIVRLCTRKFIIELENYPPEKEIEIGKSDLELIDLGLLHFIEIWESSFPALAEYLQNTSQKMIEYMGFNSMEQIVKIYQNCRMEILWKIDWEWDYQDEAMNRELVYPILMKYINQLDFNFAFVLQNWAENFFLTNKENAIRVATTIDHFGYLISRFPFGNIVNNRELVVIAYELILLVFTETDFPQDWARTQYNLGIAYSDRIRGEKAENLEKAIECYENALTIRTKTDFPQDWADLQNNLGNVYSDRLKGEKAENLEKAIECYENALTIQTETDFPQDWAGLQNNLGNVYKNRIREDKAENLEKAIECYENALKIRTETDLPQQWAETQNNLGIAYRNRIKGDKAENLELALECYKNALIFYTQIAFPQEWATTQNNLGVVYDNLLELKGDKAENLELVLECYKNALIFYTETTFPQDWAGLQYKLGNVYRERLGGDKAENLEKAIECYENALTIQTETDLPQEWAATQNNLGMTYYDRLRGDKAENLELALECYKNALKVVTETTFPQEWAATQINLANAYSDCIQGNKAENIEKAIECYKNALKVVTETEFPQKWAATQNNLGNTYRYRLRGDKAENLELALEYYKNALKVRTETAFPKDWAMTQNNLGNVYSDLLKGDKAGNLEKAIECYENALTIQTETNFPQDWAMTQNNLGLAYSDRLEGNKAENQQKAIQCYKNALKIRTIETFTIDHLQTSYNLGNLYFTQGNWSSAIETYSSAISAIEIIRNSARNDQRRQEIIAQSMDVYRNMIHACINSGQIELAIETAERSRGRHLAELMASHDLYPNGERDPKILPYLEQYEDLQTRIAWLRDSIQSNPNRSLQTPATHQPNQEIISAQIEQISQLEAQIQEVWLKIRALDPFVAGQKQVDPLPFAKIQQLIDNNKTAILCFYSTSQDTYIFIIYQDRPPQVHCCGGQNIQVLYSEFLFNNWLNPYLTRFSTWFGNISKVLDELSQRLQIKEIITKYLQGIEELIIIPHLWLHQIPFAALPLTEGNREQHKGEIPSPSAPLPQARGVRSDNRGMVTQAKPKEVKITENTTYLGDKFRLRILPSCQILNYCHQRPPLTPNTTMGIVENASEDLPYSAYECETLAKKYQIDPHNRLQGKQATVQQCRQLLDQVQTVHFSHHGQANPNNPLESSLLLSDRRLPLGELLNWRLPHLADVFLNNCETNFSVNEVTDDLLTLSSGLLCIGARGVISTLWSVDDCASALLSLFYYNYRRMGSSRSQALQQAQEKLRTMPGKQLEKDYYEHLNQYLQKLHQQMMNLVTEAQNQGNENKKTYQKIADKIKKQWETTLPRHCQEDYPFSNPYYWAGFISQGLP